MSVRWSADPYSVAAAEALSRELGLARATAAILVRRGYDRVDSARAFLAADERHDPTKFGGMGAACETVLRHVRQGSRIMVHGDYDVDGASSTAILVRALRALGGDPGWHLPSRFDEGYGLSAATVERLAGEGTALLITADCGITSADEVDRGLALGLEVVVTDHHRPGDRLPACPIVHPVVCDYPFEDLCAAGVAHKLSEALYAATGEDPARAEEDVDLVALATVADVVPLRGENRRLVRAGLQALARTRKPGLRALMRVASLDPGEVSAHTVAFRLAPRLNAAGRLQRADAALELLLTEDEARATEVADELDLLNRERQDTETRILFAAEAARAEHADAPAYVLAGEGWHQGVIGIVASRMVERHHRPCLMVALAREGGRGSGRSIAAFDLHAGLAACSEYLRRFGGHRAAAGFELDPSALDDFRRAFVRHAASVLSPEDLARVEHVDAVVPGGALGLPLAEDLERLAPFGHGNPEPKLLVPAARIDDVRAMGDEGQHSCFTLSNGGARARGVAFRTPPRSVPVAAEGRYDVVARLERNEWNGALEPRVVLRALCSTREGQCVVLDEEQPFWQAFERELSLDHAAERGPEALKACRRVVDRRDEGIAGLAGELLSSGEAVLVVCADASRRKATVERVLGGLAPEGGERLAVISWAALVSEPELARPYVHLLALDPPTVPDADEILAGAPCDAAPAFTHLAWGAAEVQFALAVAAAELDLRPALIELYCGLRAKGGQAAGHELDGLLRGDGAHARSPRLAARLVRVMLELGLVSYEPGSAEGRACRVLAAQPTDLARSPAYRAYQQRLRAITEALLRAGPRVKPVAGLSAVS